jgi:hypothetical protein
MNKAAQVVPGEARLMATVGQCCALGSLSRPPAVTPWCRGVGRKRPMERQPVTLQSPKLAAPSPHGSRLTSAVPRPILAAAVAVPRRRMRGACPLFSKTSARAPLCYQPRAIDAACARKTHASPSHAPWQAHLDSDRS